MHIKLNELLSSIRWSIGYIILIPVIVCIVVVLNGMQRVNEFEQAHFRIAESTTVIVANEISKRIKSQQRLLAIFAKHESKIIYQITQSPDNEKLKAELDKRVAESFPDYFAVSIADQQGIPVIDDFDDRIGGLCREDLKSYAAEHSQLIRIHPNSQAYHIDIIVPWKHKVGNNDGLSHHKNKINSGLLFVSFKPNALSKLLSLSSAPKHNLMLINNKINNLIEIIETGTRIDLKRDNFKLTEEEQKRLLHLSHVKNTNWNLSDFHDASLFSEYRHNIIQEGLIIHFLFIVGSILMIVLLLRAEKNRISAEKTREEMFSLFNHDLRSPLTSIFGFLEMYTKSSLCEKHPDKCKHLATRAFDNSLIMREIIDDILDVQKMEAGEMSFEFTEIEVVSVIKDTIELNEQHALMSNVKLLMLSDENVIYIKGDSRRIKQAVTNLLSNAIKYSPEQGTVTIKVERSNAGVIISVSDNGPGIDKDFQPLVFNKFSQSKSKLTRRVGGTGLGLAIVKHIVDAHKGYVTFETSADEGTTFKMALKVNLS